jgi:thiamine-phosphate pyrophosphorylase
MDFRRQRLAAARLYLVCDAQEQEFLLAALRGGVDIVQLRIKQSSRDQILTAARRFARACADHGALFILNDDPELAAEAGADGAHVGQDDIGTEEARSILGPDLILGLSTHAPAQVDDAARSDADYIGVGPVHATPTKPGRPAVGLELVRYAASQATRPWFAIGGIDAANVDAVLEAGATRIAIVRALTQAPDPERAARGLARALDRAPHRNEVTVGTT